MAQEYVLIKDQDDGMIALSKTVFESIAAKAVEDCEDCEPLTGKMHKSIECKIVKGKLVVDVDVVMHYGCNVKTTSEKLQQSVYDSVLQMTNIRCKKVHVNVIGFQIN